MNFISRNYVLIDIIQLISALISIIAGALAVYDYYYEQKYDFYFYVIVLTVAFVIMLSILLLKYWDMAISRYDLYADIFHKFNHMLRDESYYLNKLKAEGKLNNSTLTVSLEKTCQATVNLLEKLLSEITDNKISVHIKHFPDSAPEKSSLKTLCISTNSDNARKTINAHSIRGNTHIFEIVNGSHNHFATSNFKKHIQDYKKVNGNEFKITSENWYKWFNSLIIVPIRIESKYKGIQDDTKYEYLGFIICDGEKNAFRSYEMAGHVNMVKSFADGLYAYLDFVSTNTK